MFTGIVEEIGEIVEAGARVLRVRAPQVLTDARLGDSTAINGHGRRQLRREGRPARHGGIDPITDKPPAPLRGADQTVNWITSCSAHLEPSRTG